MSWTDNLQGVSGVYTPIIQTLTPTDGQALETIYSFLEHYATTYEEMTLEEWVATDKRVDLSELLNDPETPVTTAALYTLKAVSLIDTHDNRHVKLTEIGLAFLNSVVN